MFCYLQKTKCGAIKSNWSLNNMYCKNVEFLITPRLSFRLRSFKSISILTSLILVNMVTQISY